MANLLGVTCCIGASPTVGASAKGTISFGSLDNPIGLSLLTTGVISSTVLEKTFGATLGNPYFNALPNAVFNNAPPPAPIVKSFKFCAGFIPLLTNEFKVLANPPW